MTGFEYHDEVLPRQELAARVFAGRLIVYRGLAPLDSLLRLTTARIEDAFGADPDGAHRRLPFDELLSRAGGLRRGYAEDPEVHRAFRELFAALGFAPEESFWDRKVLRMVPPGPPRSERPLRSLPPHRDSWGSNIPAQINFWAPVFPVTAARTLLLYPSYWAQPIANTTQEWNLDALHAARARGESYPQLPVATETPEAEAALPCVIEPGELLCFSAAQLHASGANSSDRIRFSLETRLVSLADLEAGRGAPNVDGRPGVVARRWFTRIADEVSLAKLTL